MTMTLEEYLQNPDQIGSVGDQRFDVNTGRPIGNLVGGLFSNFLENFSPIASTAGGLGALTRAYNRLGSIGDFAK